ncbi:MAG: hypothetical protein E7163_02660 [Firmicutes bacterium]|nr:hypothetical protein [Bacillota bacterium]
MSDTDLYKSKIININDFIFRQNLEFYPNLNGLTCENNTITYINYNQIIASELLTFDLRTLPGEVWNTNPAEFMKIIKLNKNCNNLYSFSQILNKNAYDNILINKEDLENNINSYMKLYFEAKENFNKLTDDNKMLITNIEIMIASMPKETIMGTIVNNKLDEYFRLTQTIGDTQGKAMIRELKNKNLPSLIEDVPPKTKAGFINFAILLYGILNIGFIIATALLRK